MISLIKNFSSSKRRRGSSLKKRRLKKKQKLSNKFNSPKVRRNSLKMMISYQIGMMMMMMMMMTNQNVVKSKWIRSWIKNKKNLTMTGMMMMMTNLPHLQRKQENFHHQKVLPHISFFIAKLCFLRFWKRSTWN